MKEKTLKKPIQKKKPKVKKIPKHSKEKKRQKKINKDEKSNMSTLFTKINTTKNIQSSKKEVSSKIKHVEKRKAIQKKTASDQIHDMLRKETKKDKGIENAYFSKVQSLLETWPAQSEFVGEKAIVRISVRPTGKFDFKVQTQSNNAVFNKELIAFLKQLQHIGLGTHHAGRNYEFDVEFIAKE